MNLKMVGIMITMFVIITGFASAWGMNASDVNTVKGKIVRIEQTLDTHIKDSYEMHEKLSDRISMHDIMLMEQKTILLNIDKNLVILSKDVKRMAREGK